MNEQTVAWLEDKGFVVIRTNEDGVRLALIEDADYHRLLRLLPDELHLWPYCQCRDVTVDIQPGAIVVFGLNDERIARAKERRDRLMTERLPDETRIGANGFPGKVVRDDRHIAHGCEACVWVILDFQKTGFPLGFFPERVIRERV